MRAAASQTASRCRERKAQTKHRNTKLRVSALARINASFSRRFLLSSIPNPALLIGFRERRRTRGSARLCGGRKCTGGRGGAGRERCDARGTPRFAAVQSEVGGEGWSTEGWEEEVA
eukprot:1198821-Rhodomonas_salina.1